MVAGEGGRQHRVVAFIRGPSFVGTFLLCRREPLNLMEERVFYLKNTRRRRREFARTRKLFRSFCTIASVKKTLKFIIFNSRTALETNAAWSWSGTSAYAAYCERLMAGCGRLT